MQQQPVQQQPMQQQPMQQQPKPMPQQHRQQQQPPYVQQAATPSAATPAAPAATPPAAEPSPLPSPKPNTSGYNGVCKNGERFQAWIRIDGKQEYFGRYTTPIGTYDTAKEAALAYDRAVVQYKLSSSKLNFPDGLPSDDEDEEEDKDELMNPKKKSGKRFTAQNYANKTMQGHGTYDTTKEAALAYDRAVVQHKLSSSKLN
jgi:hypothetical protein